MLGRSIPDPLPKRLVVAVDAFGFADPGVAEALQPMVDRLAKLIGNVREETMAPPGLSVWARAQRTLQPWEGWLTFKDWIDRENPRFAFSVARNLTLASTIPAADRNWAALMRLEARARMAHLTRGDTIVCLPTTPFPAPPVNLAVAMLDPLRDRITCLASHGGLTGVPQVSIPGGTVGGLPVGLSIVGAHGRDAMLVRVAQALAD
jgi:amidase